MNDALWTATPVDEPVTLRDRFAMAALTGILANPGRLGSFSETVRASYEFAAAMLAEREKEPQ